MSTYSLSLRFNGHRDYLSNAVDEAIAALLAAFPGSSLVNLQMLDSGQFNLDFDCPSDMHSFERYLPAIVHATLDQKVSMMYPAQRAAWEEIISDNNRHVVLIGEGGSGKSRLIDCLREYAGTSAIISATTGIAATNIQGQTAHSALALTCYYHNDSDLDLENTSQKFQERYAHSHDVFWAVIDESSMLNPHSFQLALNRIDVLLSQTSSRGFTKMVLVGDPMQIPPVVLETAGVGKNMKKIFLEAKTKAEMAGKADEFVWDLNENVLEYTSKDRDIVLQKYGTFKLFGCQEFIQFCDSDRAEVFILDENQRAKGDNQYAKILQRVRLGDKSAIEEINELASIVPEYPPEGSLVIAPTNDMVDAYNAEAFNNVQIDPRTGQPAKTWQFRSFKTGLQRRKGMKAGKGRSDMEVFNPTTVLLKPGLPVFCLINDKKKGLVNGDRGIIVSIEPKTPHPADERLPIIVRRMLGSAAFVDFGRKGVHKIGYKMTTNYGHLWQEIAGDKKGKLDYDTAGDYFQIGLKQCSAMTVHKSQGQTMTDVYFDPGMGCFVEGQLYTALSRLTDIRGLTLARPIDPDEVMVCLEGLRFIHRYLPAGEMKDMISQHIEEKEGEGIEMQ